MGHPQRDPVLERLAAQFIGSFEHVFDDDWEHTQGCLATPELFVEPGWSFVNPGHFDEGNNWCSRRRLLESYRCLAEELMKRGVCADNFEP